MVRKKDTGEPGNRGQFSGRRKSEADDNVQLKRSLPGKSPGKRDRDWPDARQEMYRRFELVKSIVSDGRGLFFSEGSAGEMRRLAASKAIEDIGNIAIDMPEQVVNDLAKVQWENIRGMRNRLAHGYLDIDYERVWEVASLHLPEMRREFDNSAHSLPEEGNDGPRSG